MVLRDFISSISRLSSWNMCIVLSATLVIVTLSFVHAVQAGRNMVCDGASIGMEPHDSHGDLILYYLI